MGTGHVRKYVVDWMDGRLSPEKRAAVEAHLEGCRECRNYFRRMSELLGPADPDALPRLEADPYLPTRIRAEMEAAAPDVPGRRRSLPVTLRWAIASALLTLAIVTGVFLGRGLYESSRDYGASEVALVYYQAFTLPEGYTDDWQTLVSENGEQP
ncbi:MAG: hypothetical protein D6681_07605 [Calditrichaeota bacterium]|nr:MAG: hypothetical protein D6681_07605 [Calditrichota bacterium]